MNLCLNDCIPNIKKPIYEDEFKLYNGTQPSVKLQLDVGQESLKECKKALKKLIYDYKLYIDK